MKLNTTGKLLFVMSGLLSVGSVFAAPTVTRLTPPSALFSYGDATPPYIARFVPGQRFDLQATIQADAGKTITGVVFKVNGTTVVPATGHPPSRASAPTGSARPFAATQTMPLE